MSWVDHFFAAVIAVGLLSAGWFLGDAFGSSHRFWRAQWEATSGQFLKHLVSTRLDRQVVDAYLTRPGVDRRPS